MRYLPLVMTRGRLLAEAMNAAAQGASDRSLCGWCGARMATSPDRAGQRIRCPGCARLQSVTPQEDVPWRLTPAAAEALRRTRTWLRLM